MRTSNPVTITLWVISPDTRSERRFDLHITIGQLKDKLERVTGIPVSNQALSLYNAEEDTQPAATLEDDARPLGYYGARDWQFLKITDTNPSITLTGQLSDVSQVEKFELSEEAYAQRNDTVLAYKQRQKLGRFAEKADEEQQETEEDVNIQVGSRCQIESTEPGFHKRGTVRFVGKPKFSHGVWVGVEYDEPIGKNDGSVQGERYFECRQGYGVFVRPNKVETGDFPVEEIDFDEEM
ncbi:tubulin-folding cofactor B [Thelephora terrestris]|uniref:Tubulin-folding cofactor B n=1 Tax=Thelephora terrestris TaxID=56493 RepID=A0A9P6H4H9_9AGAM|nr:tubulin-folding cofactor B [Thelephora terrestris]